MSVSAAIAEEVIQMCRQGAQANLGCPYRRGNVVNLCLDTGDEILIGADMHGNRLNFKRLLEIADLDNHPRRHLVMQEVCHGGPEYPGGGGCMSHLLLEDMAELKARYPSRFHFLLSNHELSELADFPICKSKRMLNVQFRTGIAEMYGPAADAVRDAYMEFIASCPLAIRTANGIFISHSLPDKCDTTPFDDGVLVRPLSCGDWVSGSAAFRMVWGRDCRSANAHAFAKKVGATLLVQGHEPCTNGFLVPNDVQIILDCCASNASYLILPLSQPITHAQAVARIQKLHDQGPLARPSSAAATTPSVSSVTSV